MEEMDFVTPPEKHAAVSDGGGEASLALEATDGTPDIAEPEEALSEDEAVLDGEALSDTDTGEEREDGHRLRAEEDLRALEREFPEMRGKSLADLPSPRRFGELRELGLSPREAYLATCDRRVTHGEKAHLRSSQPTHSVSRTSVMTAGELRAAANLFPKLSGREIVSLYKRVNSPRN